MLHGLPAERDSASSTPDLSVRVAVANSALEFLGSLLRGVIVVAFSKQSLFRDAPCTRTATFFAVYFCML